MTKPLFFNNPAQKTKISKGSPEWIRQEEKIIITYPSFPEKLGYVHTHMREAALFMQDKLETLSKEQVDKLLAFQLGVIEWIFKVDQLEDPDQQEDEKEIKFSNFLIYYVRHTYAETGEETFKKIYGFVEDVSMLNERKLGFDSIHNKNKPEVGVPREYLARALGLV